MKNIPIITGLAIVALLALPALAQESEEVQLNTISEEESLQLIKARQKQLRDVNIERTSHRAKSQLRNNPCVGMHGTMLRRCSQGASAQGLIQESRKALLQKRLARTSYGRRIASLRARQERKKSNTDSFITPGQTTNLEERTLYRRRLLSDRGNASSYAKTTSGPLLRARTSAGLRGQNLLLPICSRRDGLRLIQCLQELGVEITPRTVGKDTWAIYQRLYIRKSR